MAGLVINKQKSSFIVEKNGETYVTKPSGNLIKSRQTIYVGDYVEIDTENNLISELLPRRNFLVRPPIANVDIVLIVMSMVQPDFSLFLVEKFLSYANFAEIKPLVIITKQDKLDTDDLLKEVQDSLDKLHVKNYVVNNKSGEGLDAVRKYLHGKVVALMGQSGVGKSSFINALTDYDQEVGKFSISINRGRHVTKEVIMLPFNAGYLVDTPGFSSFELPLTKGDLAENFPGFKKYIGTCKFNNCLHLSEIGCTVKADVEAGLISEESYNNYVMISDELKLYSEDYK
ncbi:MAG: ribosome small subunit-dependent GTPase A [Bacilli bacterium]